MKKRYKWIKGNPPTHFPSGNRIPKALRERLRKEYKKVSKERKHK